MATDDGDVLKRVAANVRALRQRRGLTQDELAEAAGLDSRRIQRLERAEVDIGLVALVRVAEALSVGPGRLFRAARFEVPRVGRPRRKRAKASASR